MSSASPMADRPSTRRLRHPAEIPFFVLMVVLNIAIIVFILRAAVVVPFLPEGLQDSGVATAIRTALIALLLLIPGLIVVRETQRAGVRGTAVQLSPHQYPELYGTAQDFAEQLGLRRRPDIFLANGNGALNAFAAQATGHDYVVLSNELFANLYQNNRNGLRFILGHEMGHIRLHHVALWYQIAVAYSELIPLLGPAPWRLREYSCDGCGAYLAPNGSIRRGSGVWRRHPIGRGEEARPKWPRGGGIRTGDTHRSMSARGAAFVGVGSMVGSGIFA